MRKAVLIIIVALIFMSLACGTCERDIDHDGICEDGWGEWRNEPTPTPSNCRSTLFEVVCGED